MKDERFHCADGQEEGPKTEQPAMVAPEGGSLETLG